MPLPPTFVDVPCRRCRKQIRVWYTLSAAYSPLEEIECPNCRGLLALDVPGEVVRGEVTRAVEREQSSQDQP